MNGINLAHNVCGYKGVQTSLYGVAEVGIKVAPMFFILKGFTTVFA